MCSCPAKAGHGTYTRFGNYFFKSLSRTNLTMTLENIIDFVLLVVFATLIKVVVSPIGAFIRWVYHKRDKPYKYYLKNYGNENSGLAIIVITIVTLLYYSVFK
jgi:heme/copper-type cytochrome/quinol oxidase subunit 2